MHRIKGKLEKHPFLAKGKLSIAQKEKVQRLESEFWGLKIHGKSWLCKEKAQGKALLKLCENWRRIQGKGVCAASFPLKLESLKKKPKGKMTCKKDLVGKVGIRAACQDTIPSIGECLASKKEERESKTRFSSERERVVGHSLGLDKEGRAHTRLSNEGGKLHLEAQELWWSVGRDRRERVILKFP